MCWNGGYVVTKAGVSSLFRFSFFFILFNKRVTDKIFTVIKKKKIANNLYAKMYMFDVALALFTNELRRFEWTRSLFRSFTKM